MNEIKLYPLKFAPIYKQVVWGGNKICRFKRTESLEDCIGESWEISSIPNYVSIVSNGKLKGKTLEELLFEYKERLIGKNSLELFGNGFPLLIKFIDAKKPLSIQVHPNDQLAKERHNSSGKTEMWYVVDAEPEAYIYLGFNQKMTPQLYLESLNKGTFINCLKKYQVQKGDAFFLPAGCVHAIGSGCFIAEIQQPSDITYRIYDYDRKDQQGNLRELHTDLAQNAIDYNANYEKKCNSEGIEKKSLVRCPYFSTNLITLEKGDSYKVKENESFNIYICVEGYVEISDDSYSIELKQGETILIPAENKQAIIKFQERSKLLEVYIE
ncbi:class I mannose-6-phosphate isomerase [Bacteroidales bacterium OttesenSCG-928-M11]|nr:class I mannose-6-phosphate isomerase [Bacteroidales bacterium OttesenSCG-928-M11]